MEGIFGLSSPFQMLPSHWGSPRQCHKQALRTLLGAVPLQLQQPRWRDQGATVINSVLFLDRKLEAELRNKVTISGAWLVLALGEPPFLSGTRVSMARHSHAFSLPQSL